MSWLFDEIGKKEKKIIDNSSRHADLNIEKNDNFC